MFDLEWNQPLYAGMQKRHPVYLEGEIIEIGAVKFSPGGEMVDTLKLFIAPKYYKKMNWNVARLTGISESDIRGGLPFLNAVDLFMEWSGADTIFLTWSNNDLRLMRQNLRVYGRDPKEYFEQIFDLQQMFDNQILHEGRSCGLTEALQMVGEEGMEAHDALHDAVNTFTVCKHLDLIKGMKEYHNSIDAFDDGEPLKAFSRVYASMFDVLHDKSLLVMVCPACGKKVQFDRWASQGKGKKIAVGSCSCGKEYFVRMRTANGASGDKRVFWSAFPGNDELRAYYLDRLEKQVERFEKRQTRIREKDAALECAEDITVETE